MYDISNFFVSVGISDISTADIAVTLFEGMSLKFRLCGLMMIDDGTNSKVILTEMCVYLMIYVNLLAKGNTKGLLVERYQCDLDK